MNGKRQPSSPGQTTPVKQLPPKKTNNNNTPITKITGKIDEEEANIVRFGQDAWCGAREMCRNTINATNEDIFCNECKIAVHSICISDRSNNH
jgi:hypothetical protein